jgi:hypothetical protein
VLKRVRHTLLDDRDMLLCGNHLDGVVSISFPWLGRRIEEMVSTLTVLRLSTDGFALPG